MRMIGLFLCLLLCACDRYDDRESSGSLGGVSLKFSGRRSVSVPESLRIRVVVDANTAIDLSRPLGSTQVPDLEVAFGSRLTIQARLFANGDTIETGDTTLTMPSVDMLRLVLRMWPTNTSGLVWDAPPRAATYVNRTYSDTLRISGAGADSAVLSLVEAPIGMALSGNALRWTPTDTGTHSLRVSVARWSRTDTLAWVVAVRESVVTTKGMVRIPAAGKPFLYGSGIGLDSGIVPTTVSLSHLFDMDPTEVTQKKFDSVLSANYPADYVRPPWSATYGVGDDVPAYYVVVSGAAIYCNALSRAAKYDTVFQYDQLTWPGGIPNVRNLRVRSNVHGYRLPTEAEWDYAARGGSDSLRHWKSLSGAVATDYANYPTVAGPVVNKPVGMRKPNGYGLHDMFGNVSEIVIGVHTDGWFKPEVLDPWGPGIWNWGGFWRFPVRGGSSASMVERTSITYSGFDPRVGFRTVLPAGAGGQGSIRPGLVPATPFDPDSTFTVAMDARLVIKFDMWDLMGETMSLSISPSPGPAGPVAKGDSITWTPKAPEVGLHTYGLQVITGASGRTSETFRLKILVE